MKATFSPDYVYNEHKKINKSFQTSLYSISRPSFYDIVLLKSPTHIYQLLFEKTYEHYDNSRPKHTVYYDK